MLLAKALAEQGQCKLGPVTAVFAAKRKGPRGAVIEAWAPLPGEYALFLADNVEVSPLLLVAAEAFVNAYGEVQLTPETARLLGDRWLLFISPFILPYRVGYLAPLSLSGCQHATFGPLLTQHKYWHGLICISVSAPRPQIVISPSPFSLVQPDICMN